MTACTVYIPPAPDGDHRLTSRCNIYARDGRVANARDNYRAEPDAWRHIGIMNQQGKAVCLNLGPWFSELWPNKLAAGCVWYFDAVPSTMGEDSTIATSTGHNQ